MNAGLVDTACRAFANTRVEPLGRGKCFAVWVYALLRKLGARWVLHEGEYLAPNPLWKKSAPKRSPKRPKSFRKRRK